MVCARGIWLTLLEIRVQYTGEFVFVRVHDVDGEIVISLACLGTIKLLVGTLCTAGVFYCVARSGSGLPSRLAYENTQWTIA